MESSVDSLSDSFRRVTTAAIPAMLDCIMAITASSPTQLFSSLLGAFPKLTKEIDWSEKLDLEHSNYVGSYVGALCHLLKKSGANVAALQSFIWRILIPLIKLGHDNDHENVKEAVGSFFDLVIETSSWGVVEATIVPYLLRLVGLSIGMPQSEELAIYKWSMQLVENHDDTLADLDMCEDSMPSQSKSLPLPMACYLLTSLLDAAMHCNDATSGLLLANGHCAQIFAVNLLWDLCNITVRMLSHSSEHRSCAINFFLPFIFKAYISDCAFEISVRGQSHMLSRKRFLMKIWKCCKTLFSLGPLERRDAYTILSLYLSFFSCIDGCENADLGVGEEAFDLRAEKEFWGEIKKGLVDKESLVRKQSLHILKVTVFTSEENQRYSDVTENISSEKSSVPQNMTKKGRWADKEAKSLGVGKICNSVDFGSDSQQKWDAFFLLYEMLEEYGTHLVEAAWNHQITLLLHISLPCINSSNPIAGRVVPDQMETLEGKFNWLGVLWERGFYHENPQVRCLIMESFLGIEWKNYGNCAKLVPEDFIFGSFIQGLNDPVHHKEFGIKGIYSSGTIEGAAKFLHQYTSYLSLRRKITFLSNLASVAKKRSFGRPGLMGLAECIASAACGGQICDNNEVENCVNDMSEIVQVESTLESYSYNNKEELLDVLRFVIESSKQHFNPNYRLKVCEKILHAAASVVSIFDVSLELLLHFISSLPQDSTDHGGPLRMKVQEWLWACEDKHYSSTYGSTSVRILKNLDSFPTRFINHHILENGFITYDDEDLEMWEFEAKRWTRVLFLVIKEEHHLDPTLMFIRNHGMDLCKQNNHLAWVPVKFLILILTVVQEFQVMNDRTADSGMKGKTKPDLSLLEKILGAPSSKQASILCGKFVKSLTSTLGGLVSFAQLSCSIFWSRKVMEDTDLPYSVRGKLGGPSQRRLSLSTTTVILQAV